MRARGMLLAVCAVALLAVERPRGLGDVVEVRHWSYDDYTRVVVELDVPVRTEGVTQLAADAGRPERLFLDLDGIWVGRRFSDGVEVGDGLLRNIRLGQNTLRRTRLVIDLERYESHRVLTLTHPHRVVVDVYGRRGGSAPGAGEDALGVLPPALRPVRTVVVDAGHGGRDPGAIGISGIREKHVTLQVAKALGEELEERGFRVIYTRRDDRNLSLEERTVVAESADGDVFISVHANAARRRSVHGVETYYLDENHERHAMDLAARENGIPRGEVNVLQQTLAKLHMEEVSPQSRRLAQIVQKQVVTGLPRKLRPQDLGVKKGPFYVLFLSNMPAILVEVGFLTHRGEAKRLRDEGYLKDMATQIAEGLVLYKGEQDTRLARTGSS
ncbi:MAG: N-acetylmuramoyl-L-alanine amidase [Myxococcota bacterium]|nr:N-acetylmuramoyl-L-alanine amidase [bacterium]MDP6074884.1 N-acetylmuramoyl-L-alanine amidase [Myxococcota bacterium]MDP6244306.1 N-acetylmuramoyl-L-alanine amidase [Myxococcota bacterium]MDP7075207.1 N-acetylmuramoyl-L-alanine amidase [Myxococcota bacterium]MDP7300889.1 N-acetylmuramoyl-L-alanine amidase [Myxococcota bacterium]